MNVNFIVYYSRIYLSNNINIDLKRSKSVFQILETIHKINFIENLKVMTRKAYSRIPNTTNLRKIR